YTLYFLKHVVLNGTESFDLQDIMRIHASFGQLIASLQHCTILHLDTGSVRDQISFGLACLVVCDDNFAFLLCIGNRCLSRKLCDDRKTLRLSRLEKLLDTGKTLCD